MGTLNATQARDHLSDLLNRVAYGGERIHIERRGKVVAVLVSPADLVLLEELEDRIDAQEAQRALREFEESGERAIPLEEVAEELGITLPPRAP